MDFYQSYFDNLYQLEKKGDSDIDNNSFVWENLRIPSDVKNILDAGCWKGEFLNSLPDTYEKTGVDISSEALKNVRCKTITCSIEVLPFPSGSFTIC